MTTILQKDPFKDFKTKLWMDLWNLHKEILMVTWFYQIKSVFSIIVKMNNGNVSSPSIILNLLIQEYYMLLAVMIISMLNILWMSNVMVNKKTNLTGNILYGILIIVMKKKWKLWSNTDNFK